MRAAAMGWALGILLAIAGSANCGGESSNDSSGKAGTGANASGGSGALGGSMASGGSSNSGATGGLPLGGTSSGGQAGNDASALDADVLVDAGPFDCGGCACDGATHYCLVIAGGAARVPPFPDAAPCADEGGLGCKALPESCGSTPSCYCIDTPYPAPICQCSDVGGGLEVFCPLP